MYPWSLASLTGPHLGSLGFSFPPTLLLPSHPIGSSSPVGTTVDLIRSPPAGPRCRSPSIPLRAMLHPSLTLGGMTLFLKLGCVFL